MNLKRLYKIAMVLPLVLVASVTFAFEKWKTQTAVNPVLKVETLSANPWTTPAVDQDDFRGDAKEADAKVILLSVRPAGFEVNEITVRSGDYLVVISNRTEIAELNIQVTREGVPGATTAAAARGRRHVKEFLKLVPGTYVVNELTHPEWVCLIVVKP